LLLDSPSDTKLIDDSPSGGLDASKQRLTFGSSDKRLSNLSADSISPSESERALKRRSRVSFADSGSKRKSSVSFAKTPKGRHSTAAAALQSPLSEKEDVHEEQEDEHAEREDGHAEQEDQDAEQEDEDAEQEDEHAEQEDEHAEQEDKDAEQEDEHADDMADAISPTNDSGAGDLEDEGDSVSVSVSGSPNLDSSMVDPEGRRASDVFRKAEQLRSAKREKKSKRQAEDGRVLLVDRHERMGRASYCNTDSYAPKSSRLSEIAPRPVVDEDDGARRSKRRKLRPLQYWRGERVDYARASGAAVPEVVDLTIRSPEATPWRRKPPKSHVDHDTAQAGLTSADSKAKTVRKKSKTSYKAKGKAISSSTSAETIAPASSSAAVAADKENAPVNKSVASNSSVGGGGGGDDGAKRHLKKRTPFFIFCTDKRGEVREAHSDMAITEQAKILGRMWGALSEDDKNKYQQLAVGTN